MSKFPVPHNEKERLKALDNYQILDSINEHDFDRITELASLICDAPISLVSLVDEKRQWFKSSVGLDVRETSRDLAFCQYAIMEPEMFVVPDATKDDRFSQNDLVTGKPDIRFYAGYPLIDPQGYALGTLCVIDRAPRRLSPKQEKALSLLGQEVISLIIERRQRQELRSFQKLFNFSNDLLFIGGMDGYFKKVNPAFEKVLGWSEEHMLNTSSYEFYHPEDIEATNKEFEKLGAGQNTVNFIQRFKAKSGEYKSIQWTSTPEPSTGLMFGIGRDITELKLKEQQLAISEEKFRLIFENSQCLMFTHDMDGNFLSVNNLGASILGYTAGELSKLSLYDIIPQVSYPNFKEYLTEIKEKGHASGQMITRHKNGSSRLWTYTNVLQSNPGEEPYIIGNGTDITESHHLERDLERTRKMLEQTNKIARVGGWEFDIVKQKVYWTSITKDIHGVNIDYNPVLSDSINFYKDGESREKIAKAIKEGIENGTSWELELELINMQGREIWVRVIGNAEFENGKCVKLHGTLQDIDEKKKIELEVIASRKLLKDILQAASEISIVATDTEGLITVFNKGAEKILGYTAEEMVGKQTTDIFRSPEEMAQRKIALSEELGREVDGFELITAKADMLGSEQREWIGIKKNGEKLMISSVLSPIKDDNDKILGYVSVATDITARKIAESALSIERARLTAFVQHAPAAVAMLDRNLNYLSVSHRWLEDYRLTGKNIVGMSHYQVFPYITDDGKARYARILAGAIETDEEYPYKLAGTDQVEYIRWEMRPWYQFNGTIGGIMIFTQNITPILKQREEFRAAKLQAEQASIAKSEFLANMSHEIRTPLNGVIGFTDLVLKTQLNETQQQYLTIVNQSANALLSIINDILDFSKIEAGKLELDVEKCDLYEIGSQATDIITYQIQKKGLEMLLNISTGLPRFIWADAVRLKQILINLLGNASKFTEKGEIELKIEALASNDGDTTIRFGVRDTGIGIKPEKQEKIFEAFSQEDSSTTKKYGGTGLGLTISNKLLGLMGSKLQLQSTPGIGSTFYFDLTFKTEQGEPITWENIEMIKKILIVDDNENNRLILKQMLLLKNIHSTEAKNGLEAIQVLAAGESFDVILMDYHMPYMDGLETIRKIRDSFFKTPDEQPVMLLYSSSDDEKIIKECEELKVNRRLVKPIKMQDIYNALSTLHKKNEVRATAERGEVESTKNAVDILVIEDNPVNMLLAKTILKRIAPNGMIRGAANGIEGIDAFKVKRPDVILMDVQMPEMNGYEATGAIRMMETDGRVPIIALTAGNVKSERERCLAAGMDDFIVKPVVEETIAMVLNKWLYSDKDNITTEIAGAEENSTHFDRDRLGDLFGDEEILTEFLDLTRNELKRAVQQLDENVASRSLNALVTTSHKLHGTSVSAGLDVLAKITHKLETTTVFHDEDVKELVARAKEEINYLLQLI